MNKKKSSAAARKAPEAATTDNPQQVMTPNQVVAYNLARARQVQGWTQAQAADALEPHLGVRWSKASVSQAERSVGGKFIRQFDADEIVAFARAFRLPLTWFFLPPPQDKPGTAVRLATADARRQGLEMATLIDLIFGDEGIDRQLLEGRIAEFHRHLNRDQLTQAQQHVAGTAAIRTAAVIRHELGDIKQWEEWLHTIANHLAHLREQAATAAGAATTPTLEEGP